MLNGLDLFSGIGGLTLALSKWVRPVTYCELDPYAQAVILSRIEDGLLPNAPIWDDVKTLRGSNLPSIDIIYGGFPCQDISVAGTGKGLEGERSGLFKEIVRLAKEIKPPFIFLENVPAIRTRGLDTVIRELSEAGYDCRWGVISAAEIGANHKRERWFLLGYAKHDGHLTVEEPRGVDKTVFNNPQRPNQTCEFKRADSPRMLAGKSQEELPPSLAHTNSERLERQGDRAFGTEPEESVSTNSSNDENVSNANSLRMEGSGAKQQTARLDECFRRDWWDAEPDVGRVAHGVSNRVDRIKGLGNAVVPAQAREAFKRLAGI